LIHPTASGDHRDIMLLSIEDEITHPFWYARVLAIYHVNVVNLLGSFTEPTRIDVLFVRWFGIDTELQGGWKTQRLHRIGFVPQSDSAAFGFVNPDNVIRTCHLVPAYHYGRTRGLLGPSSIDRYDDEEDADWNYYYVMM
jgi:hypothetical protein